MQGYRVLEPFRFPRTGRAVPNRVVLAAMTNKQSHADGSLGEDELAWLELDAPDSERSRAATEEDVERTIAAFPSAARRGAEAGFDGVEIHRACGYSSAGSWGLGPASAPMHGAASLAGRARSCAPSWSPCAPRWPSRG
jgi:2,4-dienoyl-CoA reductase-like NADH-dependent reductase (Old Yellow Enzyme family)